MAGSRPIAQARPQLELMFDIDGLSDINFGKQLVKFQSLSMVNSGYIVKVTLSDLNFNILEKLLKQYYLVKSRKNNIKIKFRLKWSKSGQHPYNATKTQEAIIVSMRGAGGPPDSGQLTFIAVDPPSWYLNKGDSSGRVYTGRVSDVINKVVNEYAPKIDLDIDETIDSEHNKWWMMRMDPKTFISSLLEWSSSITDKRTQWIIAPKDFSLTIKEQGSIESKNRATYTYWSPAKDYDRDSIMGWKVLTDNALSLVQTKIITQGCAITSGQYLDMVTDEDEETVYVKDSRTQNKKIARTTKKQSFAKPPDSDAKTSETTGWTNVIAVPEIYSAGDIGLQYNEYIDGVARRHWLEMTKNLIRCKLKVRGHGEWSWCEGLGTDTINIIWTRAPRKSESDDLTEDRLWWMHGNWLVYGYKHILTPSMWTTYIYAARFDYDAEAEKVGN